MGAAALSRCMLKHAMYSTMCMGTWEVMGLSHHHSLPPKYPKPCERGREGGTSAVVKFENLAGARPGSAGTTRQRTAAAPRSLGREGEGRGGFGTCSCLSVRLSGCLSVCRASIGGYTQTVL